MKRKRIRAIPEPTWRSKCGTVQLYHADCLKVLPTFPENHIDAVVTDPPYGIGFAAQPTKWQRRAGHRPEQWDNNAPDVSIILGIAPLVAIWGGNYFPLPPSRGWLGWIKPDAPPSMGTIELCWTNRDRNAKHIVYSIGATNAERVGHSTQKPLRVMSWTLEQIGDATTILDPFMGSGTTGVACVKTGRKFIGIEIDEKYYEIAKRRISNALKERRLFGGSK